MCKNTLYCNSNTVSFQLFPLISFGPLSLTLSLSQLVKDNMSVGQDFSQQLLAERSICFLYHWVKTVSSRSFSGPLSCFFLASKTLYVRNGLTWTTLSICLSVLSLCNTDDFKSELREQLPLIAGSAAAGVVFIVSLIAISIVCSR